MTTTQDPADGTSTAPEQLVGHLTVTKLILTVLAMSAPLGAVAGIVPLVIAEGNGVGAPMTYALMGLILLMFAVGFTTMVRNFPRTGAFYAYITGGLGKPIGLPAAFLAQLGYLTLLVGTYAFFGDSVKVLLVSLFGQAFAPWWVWAIVLWLAVSALGHFNVELSGKILSFLMVIEVLIVLVFNVCVATTGGPHGFQFESFTPSAFSSGSVGVGILFASATFLGFEGTAIYRAEVRDPARTVPRATYLAIILIGLFYVFSSWALVTFYGVNGAVDAAKADSTGMFAAGLRFYAGNVVAEIMTCMVVTSLFAATLAAHNPLARYTFALARDGVLPSFLGRVDANHGSPSTASATVSTIALLLTLPFVFVDVDAVTFYSWMFGIGTYAILVLMATTCLAVLVYFRRIRHQERAWNTLIAPGLGLVGMIAMLSISSYYFPLLVGGNFAVGLGLQLFILALAVFGCVLALVWRRTRPEVYRRIGGEPETPENAHA
ncbi:APC family permease [Mycobacterium dioxanotrophicus]|jgi:amino acid transporter|nr:APC family permease [Mycobacterium dioxanotrophicus]